MLTCIAIIANNFVLYPYMRAMFGRGVALDLPEALWELLKIDVGDCVIGRLVEKGIDVWQNGTVR